MENSLIDNNISLDYIGHLNKKGDFKKILELTDLILKQFPTNFSVLTILGIANKSYNNLDDAIYYFNLSLKLNPNYIIALNNLGNIYNLIGRHDEAISMFIRGTKASPNNDILYFNIGNSYWAKLDYQFAIKYYSECLKINPNNYIAQQNIADSYFKLNENTLSLNHIIMALDLRPDLENLWKQFSLICSHTHFINYDYVIANKINDLLNQKSNFNFSISSSLFMKLRANTGIKNIFILQKEVYSVTEIIEICTNLNSTYFTNLISKLIVTDIDFYKLCQNLRKEILFNLSRLLDNYEVLIFVKSLFKQCFLNEYIFNETNKEKEIFQDLKYIMKIKFQKNELINKLELYILACYECQDLLDNNLKTIEKFDENSVLSQEIVRNLNYKAKKNHFNSKYLFKSNTSKIVASLYEENPYPRWEVLNMQNEGMSLKQFANNKNIKYQNKNFNDPIKILIAGCGTGSQVISMANLFKNCSIDAIDISTSSLGYALNKSDEFKVNNINFIKKDILDLEDLNSNYNYIECSGVLHHMDNPKDGLNILCKLLKKNGIMKLGLYSSKARTNINKARKYIKKNKIQFSEENLKEFRKAVITDKLSHSKFKGLENIPDFYSTSNSRDLLFHVQEKQFNLHIIKKLLNNYNLNFAGFEFLNQYTLPNFKKYFPSSESEFCLKNWDIYEQNNNSTFIGMYNFFVTK